MSFKKFKIQMTENDADFQKLVDRIEKIGKIQEDLVNMKVNASESEIDEIFDSIPKEFFASKTKFDNLLQAIISNLFGGSQRERTTLLILEKLKDQIGQYFKDDEVHLIKIVEPYIFVNEWFFENNFLSVETIINESQYDMKLSQYFLPEIIENKPSLFYDRLLIESPEDYRKDQYLPVKKTDDRSFTKKELEDIKNRRKNQIQMFLGQNRDFESYCSYDPNILRCSLMSDDIEQFQKYLSKNNIPFDSTCPPSIYDPSYFPNFNYNNELRSLIEAAALFGSVKIFKFLLLNEAELRPKEIFRRVLFGGSIDIFHMVENHILKSAQLIKIKSKYYRSSKDRKTQNYVNLYMGNPVNESDFENDESFNSYSSLSSSDDDESSDYSTENKSETKTETKNSDDTKKLDDDDDDNDDKLKNEEEENDDYIWILDKTKLANQKIREYFSNCMMYTIKYGCDDISDYLYENYETMIDFEINTCVVSEREVNFCLKNFKQKLLPIFMHYPNDKDEFGNTYLMNSAYFNYTDIVKLLLKIPNIDINFVNSKNKTTALSRAADQHSFKTMKILLKSPLFEYKYSTDVYKFYVVTPFVKAAAHGYIDEMKLLIDTKKNNENNERFADMFSKRELTATFYRILESNQRESLKLILETFPDIMFSIDDIQIIIKRACYRKSWDSLLYLLDNLNDKKNYYEEKFTSSSYQDLVEMVQSVLKDKIEENFN